MQIKFKKRQSAASSVKELFPSKNTYHRGQHDCRYEDRTSPLWSERTKKIQKSLADDTGQISDIGIGIFPTYQLLAAYLVFLF
jgi:hypothetical protein